MSMAFDHSEDWIPLTSVQMARRRQETYSYARTFRNHDIYSRRNYYPSRQPPKWGRIIIAIVILASLIGGYLFYLGIQSYTSFTNNVEVAQVSVFLSREGSHQLSIHLTRIDANNHMNSDNNPYLIQGDKLQLQYKYIIPPSWLGFLRLPSAYILTGLKGYYNNGTPGTSLNLSNADEDNSIPAQFVALLATSNSLTLMPSRSIHAIYISLAGQLYEPSSHR